MVPRKGEGRVLDAVCTSQLPGHMVNKGIGGPTKAIRRSPAQRLFSSETDSKLASVWWVPIFPVLSFADLQVVTGREPGRKEEA